MVQHVLRTWRVAALRRVFCSILCSSPKIAGATARWRWRCTAQDDFQSYTTRTGYARVIWFRTFLFNAVANFDELRRGVRTRCPRFALFYRGPTAPSILYSHEKKDSFVIFETFVARGTKRAHDMCNGRDSRAQAYTAGVESPRWWLSVEAAAPAHQTRHELRELLVGLLGWLIVARLGRSLFVGDARGVLQQGEHPLPSADSRL